MKKRSNYTGRSDRTAWWLSILAWAILAVVLLTTSAQAVTL